jgi:zinc transporter ZupT
VAGFFIYIAATDIIPTIHREPKRQEALKKSAWLLVGVALISLLIVNLHGLAHQYGEPATEYIENHAD